MSKVNFTELTKEQLFILLNEALNLLKDEGILQKEIAKVTHEKVSVGETTLSTMKQYVAKKKQHEREKIIVAYGAKVLKVLEVVIDHFHLEYHPDRELKFSYNPPPPSTTKEQPKIVYVPLEKKWYHKPHITAGIAFVFGVVAVLLTQTILEASIFYEGNIRISKIEDQIVRLEYECQKCDAADMTINLGIPSSDENKKTLYIKAEKNIDEIAQRYPYPGIYEVELYYKDKLLDRTQLTINTNGWKGFARKIGGDKFSMPDMAFNDQLFVGGNMTFPTTEQKYSWVNMYNVHKYNLSGDACVFKARFRNNKANGGQRAFDSRFRLIGEHGKFIGVNFTSDTLEQTHNYAYVDLIGTRYHGEQHTMNEFDYSLNDWHDLKIVVQDRQVEYYVNEQHLATFPYVGDEKMGELSGLWVTFKGNGLVDWLRLENLNGEVIFEEGFEK